VAKDYIGITELNINKEGKAIICPMNEILNESEQMQRLKNERL
jgi:hypothetical protein